MYYSTPFDMLTDFTSPFRQKVYVVSDSHYQEMRKAEALKQIQRLELKAADYQRNLDIVTMTIEELQKEHNILPASEASNEPTPTC